MEHLYNPDGTRNRDFRPYIYPEETTYNTSIYDPSRSVNYGLYKYGVHPGATTTVENYRDFMNLLRGQEESGRAWKPNNDPTLFHVEHVRSVYSYHNGSDGKQGLYKNLYAI